MCGWLWREGPGTPTCSQAGTFNFKLKLIGGPGIMIIMIIRRVRLTPNGPIFPSHWPYMPQVTMIYIVSKETKVTVFSLSTFQVIQNEPTWTTSVLLNNECDLDTHCDTGFVTAVMHHSDSCDNFMPIQVITVRKPKPAVMSEFQIVLGIIVLFVLVWHCQPCSCVQGKYLADTIILIWSSLQDAAANFINSLLKIRITVNYPLQNRTHCSVEIINY